MKTTYLFVLLPLATAIGCYANPVNGEDGHFAFAGPHAAALGESLVLRVAHDTQHLELCGKTDCSDLLPGVNAIDSVVAADSDVPECTVAAAEVTGGVVPITIQCPGMAHPKVHLRAHLTDGSELEDRFQVAFLPAARVGIYCRGGDHCGGHYGRFAGAGFNLYARAESDDGTPLYTAKIDAAVDIDAVAVGGTPTETTQSGTAWVGPIPVLSTTPYPAWILSFSTAHPGPAHVRLTAGAASRDLLVNVADPNDIVDANLTADQDPTQYVDVDQEQFDSFPQDPLSVSGGADSGQLLITLRDGNKVWGGAGFLTVDSHLSVATDSQPPTVADTDVIVGGVAPGMGHLHFDAGMAHRDWAFPVNPPKHR